MPERKEALLECLEELKQFSEMELVSQAMSYLSKLKIGDLTGKKEEVEQLILVEEGRKRLIKILEDKENVKTDKSSLHDIIFITLLALAKSYPLNKEDAFTLREINQEDQVVTSSGHQFSLPDLIAYHNSRNYDYSRYRDGRGSKSLLNPITNSPFNLRDVVNIILILEAKKDIKIVDFKIHRQNLLNLAISGPLITNDIFKSKILRAKILEGDYEGCDEASVRDDLLKIAVSHPVSARFILSSNICQHLLVAYKSDLQNSVYSKFNLGVDRVDLASAKKRIIQHILREIARSHPLSAQYILHNEIFLPQMLSFSRYEARDTLMELARLNSKTAKEILSRDDIRERMFIGQLTDRIVLNDISKFHQDIEITTLCKQSLRSLQIMETLSSSLGLSIFTERTHPIFRLIREYEGPSLVNGLSCRLTIDDIDLLKENFFKNIDLLDFSTMLSIDEINSLKDYLFKNNDLSDLTTHCFYLVLLNLPLTKRRDFIAGIPRKKLEFIHKDIPSLMETMLNLMAEDYYCFPWRFSMEHISKIFLGQSIDEILKKIKVTNYATTKYHSSIQYHCERKLLVMLLDTYYSSLPEKDNYLRELAENLSFLIDCNQNPNNNTRIRPSSTKCDFLLKILTHYAQLYKERYCSISEMPSNGLHFVFDIDDTLASSVTDINEVYNYHWFLQNGLVINAIKPHILHPGAVELLQFVFQIPNVRVSFFSEEIEQRNIIFVHELLVRVLGNDTAQRIKDSVSFLSKNDLEDTIEFYEQIALHVGNGNRIKNLLRLSGGNLENTILIEDDESYCYPGQEKNTLLHHCFSFSFNYKVESPEKIHEVNHVYYIAGVINMLLNQKNGKGLADNLFEFQFIESESGESPHDYKYKRIYFTKREINYFYRSGLALLRKFNHQLKFYGEKNAENFLNTDLTVSDYKNYRYYEEHNESKNDDKLSATVGKFKLKLFDYLADEDVAHLRRVSKQWNYQCRDTSSNKKL